MSEKDALPSKSGLILCDKPSGMGSTTLVSIVKRRLGGRVKVGHTGTLDRFASGLMILLTGSATSFSDFFLKKDKCYSAVLSFGRSTDTLDPTGESVEIRTPEEVSSFFYNNPGTIEQGLDWIREQRTQTPPLYSALKSGGMRFSDHARRGNIIEPAPREISIYSLKITGKYPEKGSVEFDTCVSSGTYIRSIARDLGVYLNFPVHLSSLRRISVGELSILNEKIWSPDLESMPEILPMGEMLTEWPRIVMGSVEVASIRHGRYPDIKVELQDGTNFFFCTESGEICAWAIAEKTGYRYKKVFSD